MLIKNCTYIITQNPQRKILKNYDILIKKNKIYKIKKNIKSKNHTILSGKNKAILPGLINCHTHTTMTFLRGYADDIELHKWLTKKIWPQEAKLTPKKAYKYTLLGCKEHIRFGTTCINDMYLFINHVVKAVEKSKLRAILCSAYFDHTKNPFAKTFKLIKKYKNHKTIKFALGPHSPYTCSKELLIKTLQYAKKYNLSIHTHVAETKKEFQEIKIKHKSTPIEYLNKINFLNKNTIIAHAIWLTKKDIKILSKTKTKIAHCPTSNMKLCSGTLPLNKILKANITIALGTDSAASNNNLDIFEEMKTAALLHKHNSKNPTTASAQQILDLATINAAKALNLEKEIGSIETGKKADIITIDLKSPHLQPTHNIISNIVYSANGNDVNDTIVNGKLLMKNKKIIF